MSAAPSGELNVALYDALKQSEFLIVIASPASAQSRWVNEEVRFFKQHNGEARVLVVIAEGVPFAKSAEECFVPALRHQVGPSGEVLEHQAEPLAADEYWGNIGTTTSRSMRSASRRRTAEATDG